MTQSINAFLKTILDTVHEPCVILDSTLYVRLANTAFCRLLYSTPSAVVHRRFDRLFSSGWDGTPLRSAIARTASAAPNSDRAQIDCELALPLPTGLQHFQTHVRHISYETAEWWLVAMRGTTVQPALELLDQLPIGVYRTLKDGTFLRANKALAAILGCSSVEELLTSSARDFYYTPEERDYQWQQSRKTGSTTLNETRFRTRDGRTIWVRDVGRATLDADGAVLFVDGSIEDITDEVEAAARLRMISKAVDSTGDGVVIFDADGQAIYQNKAHFNLFGCSIEELNQPHNTCFDFRKHIAEKSVSSALNSGRSWKGEIELIAKDQRRVYTLMNIDVVADERGQKIGYVSTLRDITEMNQAQQELRKLNADLELHNTALQAVQQISLEISAQVGVLNTDDLLERVLQWAVALLESDGGEVLLHRKETDLLEVVSAVGRVSKLRNTVMPAHEGLVGLAFQKQRAQKVDDYGTWQHRRFNTGADTLEIKAAMAVPLLARQEAIGAILIVRQEPFDEEELWLAQTFASQAAVIIENARLFREQRRQQEIATSLRDIGMILTSTLTLPEALRRLILATEGLFPQANSVTVQLLDDNSETMETIAASNGLERARENVQFRPGEGLAGHAITERIVINAKDVNKDPRFIPGKNTNPYQSLLVAPLLAGERAWGALSIGSDQLNAFSADDEKLAEVLGRQAGVAIENTLLLDEVRRYAAEQEARVSQRTMELERAKRRVETILFNSMDGIALLDEDGVIEQTNPSFDALFGYAVDEAFGKSLLDLTQPNYHPIIVSALRSVKQTRQSQRIEAEMLCKDGSVFVADIVIYTSLGYNDAHLNLVCSLRDVTERRQMEENLLDALEKEKQLNELKSRFGSMVSHEFRTPLAIILSSVDLLARYGHRITDEKRRAQISKIQSQVKHLSAMLDDILMISRAETVGLDLRPIEINLLSFCRDLLDEIRLTTHQTHTITFEHYGVCDHAYLDARLLRQALSNLVHNAVKYTPSGGEINVELRCHEDTLIFTVSDHGIGIPPADLERIFDPFHRASNVETLPGTGLGLAITKQSIESQDGQVSVQSEIGKGTTFTIVMPLRLPQSAKAEG